MEDASRSRSNNTLRLKHWLCPAHRQLPLLWSRSSRRRGRPAGTLAEVLQHAVILNLSCRGPTYLRTRSRTIRLFGPG